MRGTSVRDGCGSLQFKPGCVQRQAEVVVNPGCLESQEILAMPHGRRGGGRRSDELVREDSSVTGAPSVVALGATMYRLSSPSKDCGNKLACSDKAGSNRW